MKNNNTKLLRILFYSLGIIIALALVGYFFIDIIIEFWWFDSINHLLYFVMRDGYRDAIAGFTTLIFGSIFYFNFILVSKNIEHHGFSSEANDNLLIKLLKSRPIKLFIPLSLLLTIPILIPVYTNWETILLYYFSHPSGITDPAYGKDISYYFFSYPVYRLLQQELLVAFSLLCAIVAFLYWHDFRKFRQNKESFPSKAKSHLTVLVIIVVLLQGWAIVLERIELLYEDRHMPVFFGPGMVEMRYDLPLIWLAFFTFLGAALSVIYFIHKHRGLKLIAGFSIAYLVMIGLRQISFIPELIDDYYVKPNPVKAEKRYMQYHIDATLASFGLDQVKQIDYPAASSLTPSASTEISQSLYNIPLWESHLLKDVYEQLQAIKPYFSFSAIATDRYTLGDKEHQVNIATRELSLENLPLGANNWENRHQIYTHGYGAVVTPSAQQANQPVNWFLRDIKQTSAFDKLKISQPEIYYGLGNYEYAIVPNEATSTLGHERDMSPNYMGTGGISISSLWKKLFFSAYLKEPNIIFSGNINNRSKLLFRRNITERITHIAPFLEQDPNPYPVIIKNKLYWIIDAYTTSNMYPLVARVDSPLYQDNENPYSAETLNYIRNSVKIIVDAYNGSVDFYIVDKNDPLISTYSRAFPTLFKDIDTIPKEFLKHLSYPKTQFRMQMEIFARFHQKTPEIFYQQNERLELAHDEPSLPFYLTVDILEKELEINQKKFILVDVYSPYERDNLAYVNIAGCLLSDDCENHYRADIFAYKLPSNVQIEGPAQITAFINQTPEISSQFTLWDQRGSKVIKGRIIIIPIEERILYIQPIYLAATSKTGFPQLARVIVAMNHQAVMDVSLESAFKKLQKRLKPTITHSANEPG